MKKYLKIVIPIIVISFIAFMGYKVIDKINHKKEIAENIKTIPEFTFQTLEGELFTNQNLKKDTPTLFIYYNSECSYCNEEAKMIYENIENLKNIQIIFISFETTENIKLFATNHKLIHHDNIHFISDSQSTFASTFDVKSLPCLVLYNKKQELIEKIKGQIKIETLLKKLSL